MNPVRSFAVALIVGAAGFVFNPVMAEDGPLTKEQLEQFKNQAAGVQGDVNTQKNNLQNNNNAINLNKSSTGGDFLKTGDTADASAMPTITPYVGKVFVYTGDKTDLGLPKFNVMGVGKFGSALDDKASGGTKTLFKTVVKDGDTTPYRVKGKTVKPKGSDTFFIVEDMLSPTDWNKKYDANGNVKGSVAGDNVDPESQAAAEKAKNEADYNANKTKELNERTDTFNKEKGEADAALADWQNKTATANQLAAAAKTAKAAADADSKNADKQKAATDAQKAADDAQKAANDAKTNYDKQKAEADKAQEALGYAKNYDAAAANFEKAKAAGNTADMQKYQAEMDKWAQKVKETN